MTAEVDEVSALGLPRPRRCWSTEDVQPRHALAYWVDSICQVMLELDIEAAGADFFRAQLDQYPFGPATANFLVATPQAVSRTRRRISRSHYDDFQLIHLRDGEFELEQYGRSGLLRGGDCVLVDSSAPYKVRCPRTTRCLVLQLPSQWLGTWLPKPEVLAGRVLHPDTGWGAALSAAMAALQPAGLNDLALPAGVVAEQIASLLALAGGPVESDSLRPDVLTDRLFRVLRDRYHEIGLTPAAVAHDLGISARYLHHLFAKRATTFGRELAGVRLERARELLNDRRFADIPIGDVASRCGFAEARHFARRFRATHGFSPSDFRRRLLRRNA
jgi:AraC family transcriptional activator of tynA and feaB